MTLWTDSSQKSLNGWTLTGCKVVGKVTFYSVTAARYRLMKDRAAIKNMALPFTLAQFREFVPAEIAKSCKCRYCGLFLSSVYFSVDHRHPISLGGSWGLDNLDIVCYDCNSAKGVLTGPQFEDLLNMVNKWDDASRKRLLARLKSITTIIAGKVAHRRKPNSPRP